MNNKLTFDIIADYIRENLKSFNDDEIIFVEEKKTFLPKKINNHQNNQNNQINSKIIEKINFIDTINSVNKFNHILFDTDFFNNLYFVDTLKDFFVLKTHSIDNKIYSFYTCLLSSLDSNYTSRSDEMNCVNNLIQYLKTDIMQDGFRQHGYSKLKWTKNKILEDLNKNVISDKIIRYASDALHINIFYIDNDDDNKIKFVGGDFVPFKKIILLLKIKSIYYLICSKEQKYFIFNNNNFIKSLLINQDCINLILCEQFNCVGRNYFNITDNKDNKDNKDEDKNDINTEQVIEKNINNNTNNDELSINGFEEESVTNKKLNTNNDIYDNEINESLSLIELQKKAKELQIDTFCIYNSTRKLKNKKELCRDIINKLVN